MFGSSVLDVAVGVVFGFLAISLMTSAIVEGLNSIVKLRSFTLLSGIKSIVNDPKFQGMAKDLYAHALISPRAPANSAAGAVSKPTANKPSYIDKMQFASAMMDITGLSAASAADAAQQPGPAAVAAFKAALDQNLAQANNPQIKSMLAGIIQRANGDAAAIQKAIADWFDSAMDRVSGVYKRYTQVMSFGVALLLAALLNVDTVHLAEALWAQPTLVANLKLDSIKPPPASSPGQEDSAAAEAATAALDALNANVPVGWTTGQMFVVMEHQKPVSIWSSDLCLSTCFGWVITAIATLFGAPFWFDILQSAIRLKGAGPSPSEKISGAAAAD